MSSFDKNTLQVLSVFHYVSAGLIVLLFCLPMIYFGLGITLVVGGVVEETPALGVMGLILTIIATIIIVIGWFMAFLVLRAGKNLEKRKNYKSCLIGAGILCIFIPLGTILGIFTLVVLQEDSIKEMFSLNSSSKAIE